jgi:hypothetical protein
VDDPRLVINVIDAKFNPMPDTARLDHRDSGRFVSVAALALAVEHVAHGQDGLEGVALRASGRRAIGFA